MSAKDIRTAPQAVRDFIRRQGMSLNPLAIHATYRLPQDFKDLQPKKTRYHFFLLPESVTSKWMQGVRA